MMYRIGQYEVRRDQTVVITIYYNVDEAIAHRDMLNRARVKRAV